MKIVLQMRGGRMNHHNSTFELLLRYLEDDLSADERSDVEELLRQDQAARNTLREIAGQAVVIADVARVSRPEGTKTTTDLSSDPIGRFQGPTLTRQRLLLALAATVLLAVSVSLLRRGGEPEIVTIKALNGPVEWIGSGGHITDELVVGATLSGGTIELLSSDSWLEFEFRDESTVTLSGQTAVTVSEQNQKELHLRYGGLSASVKTQQADRPMLVHTPTAELKVLGTQFNVDAQPETTRLTVNEGRVRLKRLADGKEVDVPAEHEVTASLEEQTELPVSERGSAVSSWKSDLEADVVRGKWVSRLWSLAAKLKKAVASGEMTKSAAIRAYKQAAHFDDSAGSVWMAPSPVGSLIVLSPRQSMLQPVLLNTNTKIIVRGRSHSKVGVAIGLSVGDPNGGFAGKYSTHIPVSELAGGDAFEFELPVNKLRNETKADRSPVGSELTDLWFVAEASAAKFEITSVEVTDALEKDKP
ncbi:MAG: hypothetical protein Aurels2KO_34670 [Aureliella sp.]